jgi:hypothetical protein
MAWAVLATGSGDSSLVLVTASATPGGPTAVPWVDSTPGPQRTLEPEPTPGPELLSVRACQAGDLSSRFVGTDSHGGYDFFTLGFVNVSSTPCRLQGTPPSFQLLDADGNVIQTAPLHNCPNASACGDNVAILQPGSGTPVPLGTPSASQALLTAQSSGSPYVTCAPAAVVSVVLPENGGQLTIPAGSLKACGADPVAFVSDAPPGTPAPTPAPLFSIGLHLPAAVRAGDQLDFLVSFTNVSGAPVEFLSPCPSYDIWLGPKQVIGAHSLNCGSVGAIPPGHAVWFDMKLRIPANMPTGPSNVTWQWDGEDYVFEPSVYDRAASNVIEILAPAPGVPVPSATLDPNQPTFDK